MTTTRKLLGGTRALIGLSGWIAPDLAARAFGIDPNRGDRFITRLFASRELALSLALLTAPPAHLRAIAGAGALIDTADAVAGLGERGRGGMSTYTFVSGVVGAAAFAAMGAKVAHEAQSGTGAA